MANIKSAKKRAKQMVVRNARNVAQRSQLRTAVKKANAALTSGNAETVQKAANRALSLIGRTAKKGMIHKKKAARLESRLQRKVNAALKPSGS